MKMSKWISVKDALPEVGLNVITIGVNADGDMLSPIVAVQECNGKFICGYRFCGDREIGFFIETFPTHWMLLPEPPELPEDEQ